MMRLLDLHTHGRHCCLVLDYRIGTARFPEVINKASSNAFLYIVTLVPPLRRERLGILAFQSTSAAPKEAQNFKNRGKDSEKNLK